MAANGRGGGRAAVWLAATAVGVAAPLYYGGALRAYAELLQVSDYSYLLVLLAATPYLLYRLTSTGGGQGPLESGLQALAGVSAAAGLYGAAQLFGGESVGLRMLSLALLAWSLLAASGTLSGGRLAASLLLLMALAPLPAHIINWMTSRITQVTAPIAALLAGGRLVSRGAYLAIVLPRPSGPPASVEISPLCGGVSSLLVVLALLPAAAYLAASKPSPRPLRIAGVLVGLLAGAATVLVGDAVRIAVLARLAAEGYSGLYWEIAHSGLPIAYVAAASLLELYLADRVSSRSPLEALLARAPSTGRRGPKGYPVLVAAVAALGLAYLGFVAGALGSTWHLGGAAPPYVSAARLLEAPGAMVFNSTGARLSFEVPQPLVGEALGALRLEYVSVSYHGVKAMGYVEVAESPARFHSWYVCLPAQGYRILEHWSVSEGNLTVDYILASRTGRTLLLAYTIVPIKTNAGKLYVKVSLFTPTRASDPYYKASVLGDLLSRLLQQGSTEPGKAFRLVRAPLAASLAFSAAAMASPLFTRRLRGRVAPS